MTTENNIISSPLLEIIYSKIPTKGDQIKRFKSEGYDDLVCEIISEDEISIAHYFKQNGDSMADPEMVFKRVSQGKFIFREMTQAPVQRYVRAETATLAEVKDAVAFFRIWEKNIIAQDLF